MSAYYAGAAICIAYLADVDLKLNQDWQFETSCWFGRGWTLQELLFPPRVMFLDRSWTVIGFRDSTDVAAGIERATGIPPALVLSRRGETLRQIFTREDIPVAQKMSWVAQRRTTREEDAAYCLLGIFDVNMPLIHGEGGCKAFRRLQQQIVRSGRGDASLFIWRDPLGLEGVFCGLLADHPSYFERARDDPLELSRLMTLADDDVAELGNGCLMLNAKMLPIAGITFDMRLESTSATKDTDTLVLLDHRTDIFVPVVPDLRNRDGTYLSILLRKANPNRQFYSRIFPAWTVTLSEQIIQQSLARDSGHVKIRIAHEPSLEIPHKPSLVARDSACFKVCIPPSLGSTTTDGIISLFGIEIKVGALKDLSPSPLSSGSTVMATQPAEGHVVPVRHYGEISQAEYGVTHVRCKMPNHRLLLISDGTSVPTPVSSRLSPLEYLKKLTAIMFWMSEGQNTLFSTHGKVFLPAEYGWASEMGTSSSEAAPKARPCVHCSVNVPDYGVSLWGGRAVLTIASIDYSYREL